MSTALQLKRSVSVKVVMTAAFRKQLIDEASETIARIDENLTKLDSAVRPNPATEVATPEVENEKKRLLQMRGALDWRIKEVERVEDGAEIPFRVIEGLVDISVGDNFLKKMAHTEIVIKDWEVVEIRQG